MNPFMDDPWQPLARLKPGRRLAVRRSGKMEGISEEEFFRLDEEFGMIDVTNCHQAAEGLQVFVPGPPREGR